jgi:hypothetical protein
MKTVTFNEVTIGNKFFYKNEWYVKMNKSQAIANINLIDFNLSQYVTIAIEIDRVMCS